MSKHGAQTPAPKILKPSTKIATPHNSTAPLLVASAAGTPLNIKPARSIWSVQNGNLVLDFHEGQARAWQSTRRFVFVFAGTQGGKTAFGGWWLWREIRNTLVDGEDNDYLVATSSYDLFKLKLLPSLIEVFITVLGIGKYWSGDRIIEIAHPDKGFLAKFAHDKMYARIILRSAAAGGGLESATAKAAWLDEAGQDEFALEDWEAVQRRLSIASDAGAGRVLATTTIYNAGWVKTEIQDKYEAGDKTIDVINFPSYKNPSFPRAEYIRARNTMPAWRFKMFYKGEFSRPRGLILGDLQDFHIIPPRPLPAKFPRYLGLDFGGANTAKVWVALDPLSGNMYVYKDELSGDQTTEEHASEILTEAEGVNFRTAWGGAPSETQPRADFNNEGVQLEQPPIADVESGIDKIIIMLKARRLFIFNTCRGLLAEAGTYRRKLDEHGVPTNEIEDKRKFHHIDALRYVISGIWSLETGGGFAYNYLQPPAPDPNRVTTPKPARTNVLVRQAARQANKLARRKNLVKTRRR